MRLIRKGRVLTALLGAAVASGVTTLVLILVEATNVLLPTDTKVCLWALSGGGGPGCAMCWPPCPDPGVLQFGIVFDAGSSHTSLFVYRWPADKENDTGVVSQALACQVKGQWAVLLTAVGCWELPGAWLGSQLGGALGVAGRTWV